ncbi:hypothetical protein [Paraburkholderia sp.]|uniref:hypothetical protein n=1 Tax=Paraburkholderia sp. TaxID=1926495 RepID=UPI0039E609FD
MKKVLICILLALVMTVPVTVGIARLPGVYEWLDSGAGYDFLKPLFIALGSNGCESHSDIVVGILYLVGFIVSLVFAVAAWTVVSRLRRTDRH